MDKQTGDKIREYDLAGVKVDEDYKRNYPYGNLASKVLGFTGSDNQGIVGLEVKYESILKGTDGQILTCLLCTSPSPRDPKTSRMPSSA